MPTEVEKHTKQARDSMRSGACPEESREDSEGRSILATEAGSEEDSMQHCGGSDWFHVAVVTNELSLVCCLPLTEIECHKCLTGALS